MVGLVVATHGRLASVLLETAAQVCGPIEAAVAVDVPPAMAPQEASEQLRDAIEAVDRGSGVLVLVDLLGGTPWNRSVGLIRDRDIEVLAGVNLPMLIKFSGVRDRGTPVELARMLARYGAEHMELASVQMRGPTEEFGG